MIDVHLFWAQGWGVAPPMAVRNAEAWEEVGTVHRWSMENLPEGIWKEHPVRRREDLPYAMQQDVALAAAQATMGGLAVGADMVPLRPRTIRRFVEQFAKVNAAEGRGFAVFGHAKKLPFNGFSWFPAGNEWIETVRVEQEREIDEWDGEKSVSLVTGPRMWDWLTGTRAGMCWWWAVDDLDSRRVFLFEPGDRDRRTAGAWVNPGLNGDWRGEKPEVWW